MWTGGVDGGPERAERSAGRGIELEIWESGFLYCFFNRAALSNHGDE